jgi:hypothetical protein
MSNATVGDYDDLPEPIREYLRRPEASADWSAQAIRVRIRLTGSIEGTLEFLRAADANRRLAAYRELGFETDPATGEPL